VPSNRKRARVPWRSRLAAVVVVAAVAAGIAYLAIKHAPVVERPTACVAGAGRSPLELTVGQAAIAATIAGVASARAMPPRAVAIAYAAALQESKLSNLHYGTADSVGVFQQRPSQGWGTARQIENPVYATDRFFAALAAVPNYLRLPIYAAAQAVQHSADGSAYSQYATDGTDLAAAFTGTVPHAVWCAYGAGVGKPRLAAARRALTSAFGRLPGGQTPGAASTDQASTDQTGTDQAGTDQAGTHPADTVQVKDTRQGWAVAAWLVSNAAAYGIKTVRYQGYSWLASTISGRWQRPRAGARPRAGTASVVFG
jgi:hypothetical protein